MINHLTEAMAHDRVRQLREDAAYPRRRNRWAAAVPGRRTRVKLGTLLVRTGVKLGAEPTPAC
jgi:hypothetical protein